MIVSSRPLRRVCVGKTFTADLLVFARNPLETEHNAARDLRLPPRLKLILPSSGLLRGVRWF